MTILLTRSSLLSRLALSFFATVFSACISAQVAAPAATDTASAPLTTPAASVPIATSSTPAAPATPAQNFIDREDVRAFIKDFSARSNIPIAELEKLLSQAKPVPSAVELIKPSTQISAKSWQRYRARFVDRVRISSGLEFWSRHRTTLEAAEARFGVPAEIMVSIIGIETVYGRNTGSFNTLSTLATLAFDYPPRAELFRSQLEALILLAQEQGRSASDYKGSYAGALGLPQFLPSSVRSYAVDFDQDGKIDLLNSPADAIGSVANFMVQHGWEKGGRIAVRARLESDANVAPLIGAGIKPQFDPLALALNGVVADTTEIPEGLSALIDLATPDEPTEYWLGYQNFYVITRYNRSSFYAMTVADLARALRHEYNTKLSQTNNAAGTNNLNGNRDSQKKP